MTYDINPFPKSDTDRYEIWEMLVHRDIDAFLNQDWSIVAGDFIEESFIGIDGEKKDNPDLWSLHFPNLETYKKEWLKQSADFAREQYRDKPREALFNATCLKNIEIRQNSALLHKKFDGQITKTDNTVISINWQTLYFCIKQTEKWKITGFVGYLPNPMGK